ncbi:MAG: alpha/beta fold hydrolase [Pseudomonadota bacterium]
MADAARRLYLLDIEADRVRSRRRALVLIHGYNTPFEQALLRVAQLASEVNYPGRIYLFSWPSQNSTVRYLSDMERAEQSEPYLSGFLRGIARDPQIREIDFIAHSMGAQILTRALGEISDIFFAREKIGIGQVILVAPDVAVEVFSEKWRGLMPLVKGLTIFSSKADWPLGISRYLRGSERRLGQILDRNKLSLQNNFFRIVDVTPERSVCNGWGYAMLGHNHFRNVPEMRLFIKRILRKTIAEKDFSAKEKALLEAPQGTARLKMKAPACF